MNFQPFTTAAKEWLSQGETNKIKLTKSMKQSVLSFAFWLDDMIQKQEMEEQKKNEKEN